MHIKSRNLSYLAVKMPLRLMISTSIMCAAASIQTVDAASSYGFAAESTDSNTGLVYNRERVYDPSTGSFLSKDTLGVQGGLNNYQYSGNNPINYVDPLGTSPTDIITGYSYGVTNGLVGTVNGLALISSGSAGQLLNTFGLFPTIPKLTPVGAINQDFISGQNGGSFFFNVGSLTLGAGSLAVGITRLTTVAPAVLESGALPLNQFVTGVSDDALVHFSREPLSTVEPVNGAVYSFQYGDISSQTATQIESLIGPMASSGEQGAAQVLNVIDASVEDSSYVLPGNQPAGFQPNEYVFENSVPVVQSIQIQGAGVSSISLGTTGAASTVSLGSAFGGLAVTGPLAVGGVLINQAATYIGSNLADIKGATFDPTTKQIIFLGTNQNGAPLTSPINMDYFYTAIQSVYGSATPPYVTLDPPATAYTQWNNTTFVNNTINGFTLRYNPIWSGEDTTVAIRFLMTDGGGHTYDFTENFNCVPLDGRNGITIQTGWGYAMSLIYNNTTGTPPSGLNFDSSEFQPGFYNATLNLTSTGQDSYYPVLFQNATGSNLIVNDVEVVPARQHRQYGGRVDGTKLGWAMYEADRVMKCLSVGKDNLTGALYNSSTISVPGYQNLLERAAAAGSKGSFSRMWFEPNDMTLQSYIDPVGGSASVGFQSSTVQLLTEAYLQGIPADPIAQSFVTHFTQNYSAFAALNFPVLDPTDPNEQRIINVPIFAQLQQAMQAVCLARFFHDNNIPLDNWWMSSYQPPTAYSPKTVATASNTNTSGSITYTIYGGVQIYKPNVYVPSSNAQSLGTAVISNRPVSTSGSAQDVPGQLWNVNGTTQGNVTAVSASLAQDSQNGNVKLTENDLTFASPGELPLQFTRYYQSSWIGTTNLGPGWRDVRYMVQFSNLSLYDQNHLLTDSSSHALTTATSGDTYLHSGTVRLVDLSSGSNLNFSSSLSVTYSVNGQGNPVNTLTGLNASDLPTFTPASNQSNATLTQNNDGTFDYTATLPDGSSLLFDPNGNLLQTIDRHGHKQIYAYSSGQLNTVTDDAGQILQLNYTGGLLSSVSGPAGEGTTYHYNSGGLLTSVVNALSNVQIAQYSYNSATNQLATVTRMDGTTPITTTPDSKGRSSSRVDVNGNSTNYAYVKNSDGSRTTSASMANSGLTTAQVNSDKMGRSTSVSDMLGNTTSFNYTGNSLFPNSVQLPTANRPAIQVLRNDNGLPTSINDPAVVGAFPTQLSYYPSSNLPKQVLDGAQRPTNFYYTSTNNLQTLRRQHNGANVDIIYGYDSQDNLNTIQDPLTHTWTIGHDNLGRIISAKDPTGVQSSCTYDQYGNVSTATIPGATIPGQTYSIKYSYDLLHRLTGIITPTGSTSYQYDPVTQWVDTATQKDTSGNTLETVSYNYNNSTGQVTGLTTTLSQPGSSNSTPITTTYGYNAYGSVSSVTPSGAQPLNFNYNAAGQLVGTSETDSGPAVGPTIIASNASSGVWTNQNNQNLSWGAPPSSLPVTGYSYAEDGNAGTTVNATGTSLAWNNISDGQHLFAMKAVDSAGNWSPQSVFNLWVDTTPPTISNVIIAPTPIPLGNVTITASSTITDSGSGLSGAPMISWYVGSSSSPNWSSYTPMTQGAGSQWTSSFVESGAGQTLFYKIQALDVAGNSSIYNGSTNLGNYGPAGYWAFNEGVGTTTTDFSGNANNGTLTNGPTWVTGWLSNSLNFNGTNSYVNLNNTSSTGPLKPPLPVTISAWIKFTSTTGYQGIFVSDNFSSVYNGCVLETSGGVLECVYGSGGGAGSQYRRTKLGTTVMTSGQWYHVAAIIQGPTTMNLYVNGVDDGGTYSGTGGPLAYTTSPSKIGTMTGTQYFNGSIDDVRFYNRVLSPAEIELLANGPIGNWRFDEGMGTTALDSGTVGLTGTLTNSPVYTQGWFGDALNFNGTNSYVNLNNASSTSPLKPALPVTVSAWIKPASASGYQAIFASDSFNNPYYGYDMKLVGGVLSCDYGSGTGAGPTYRRSKNGTTVLTAGQWYFVSAVIQGPTSMNLYVNGVDDGGTYSGTGGTIQYSSASSKIGTDGGVNYFNGVIDDVRVYTRALSPTEVQTQNNSNSGLIPPE